MLNCRYILHSFLLYETTNFSVFYDVSRLRFRKHFPPDFVRLFRFLVYLFINYFFPEISTFEFYVFFMWGLDFKLILFLIIDPFYFESMLIVLIALLVMVAQCMNRILWMKIFVSWWFSLTGNNLLKFCEVSVIMLMNIKLYLCA